MLANACFVNSGQENPFYSKDMIQLKNSSYETHGINDEKLFLKSKEAKLNLKQHEIFLLGDVIGQFSFDEENFRIKTENLTGNLLNNTFFSKDSIRFIMIFSELYQEILLISLSYLTKTSFSLFKKE